MKYTYIFIVTLLTLILTSTVYTLKVDRTSPSHAQQDKYKNPTTNVENLTDDSSCTKDLCMSKYGLLPDPFNPMCDQNATCWRQWYGFPDCKDDDINCWKKAVGYPKDCKDDDYDCWIKEFGYAQCQDAQCIKDYLNYTCKYDDLQCWKTKTWTTNCKWNDWDCWVKNSFMSWICDDKKGYQCVKSYYASQCKQDDEACWRKALMLPDADCQKDVQCYKKYYYLPDCKDDDFDCWKKLYWGPDCKKGDIQCLKKYLFLPDCTKQKDQVACYKKWLGYPDCKLDDGKCWKDYSDKQGMFTSTFWLFDFDHKKADGKQNHNLGHMGMNFGKIMQHKRKMMAQGHKLQREFHMKRAGLIQ